MEFWIETIGEIVGEILSFLFDGFLNKVISFIKRIRRKRKDKKYTTLRR